MSRRLVSLVDALAKTLHVPRRPRLSVGLAMPYDLGSNPTPTALLAEADRQLYQVKSRRKTPIHKNTDPPRPQPLSA
jgi:GGDEF domain-containing protein